MLFIISCFGVLYAYGIQLKMGFLVAFNSLVRIIVIIIYLDLLNMYNIGHHSVYFSCSDVLYSYGKQLEKCF